MAATYVLPIVTAKDRVRLMIADRAAPFSFQDEEIAFALTDNGFEGDPLDELPKQELPELLAAVALMEGEAIITGTSNAGTTIKQGSVERTERTGAGVGRSSILFNLRKRLAGFLGDGGPVVVDGFADDPRFACRPYL